MIEWREAVAVGLRAAAWWLQRRAGSRALLAAFGVAGAAALAALAGGPIAVAGTGLVSSVLAVTGLGDVLRSARAALGDPDDGR